jgi:tetratricopeptide (TPR) repeat protein
MKLFKWSQPTLFFLLVLFILANSTTCEAEDKSDSLNKHLLQGIEACFSGDYDGAWTLFDEVKDMAPGHPSREFYQATVLFWKNNVDHSNPRFDSQIKELLLTSLKKAENRLEKDKKDIESLHYMGLAYTYLGRMDAHRGKLYSGGVKGETGREYLEKAMEYCQEKYGKTPAEEIDNSCNVCEDIYFPFGAYSYFSGRLPKLLRFFNFLWFIPKGSTEEGLMALSRALENGCLHQLGTQTLLTSIYSRFEEDRIQDAFSLSKKLVTHFPNNPYLDLEHARLLVIRGEYIAASLHAETILTKVSRKQKNYDHVVELGAKLIIIESALHNQKLDEVKAQLKEFTYQPQYQNNTLTACIFLLKGQLADLSGKREEAISYYQKVIASEGHLYNRPAITKAKLYLDNPFTPAL